MNTHKLISMQCGDDESYALLFYESEDGVMLDIYDAGTKALIQTLKSPFPKGSTGAIRHCQSFDVMFFAHGATYPCKLKRERAKEGEGYVFSFEDNEFLPEPVLDWEMKSEHSINVFALPDEELIQEQEDGTRVFPKGVVREVSRMEDLQFAYSYNLISVDHADNDHLGPYYLRVAIYGFATTENFSKYKKGIPFKFDSPLSVSFSYWSDAYGGIEYANVYKCTGYDGGPMEYTSLGAKFSTGVIEKTGNGGVFVLCGYAYIKCIIVSRTGNPQKYISVSGESPGDASVKYGENQFYVTIADNVPYGADVENVIYYKPASGSGFEIAMTIDGSNENESICIGQIIALKSKNSLYDSQNWDYDSIPVGSTMDASPPVDTLDVLPSKTDSTGLQLRPQSGGGYGYAGDWHAVRGKVELKTEGKWSGVIELQELDSNGDVGAIATISSENGMSNTKLERDIEDFGSCVRVACTRREHAYEIRNSVSGEGTVFSHTFNADEGLQWTLSSTDVQTAYLRVKEKRELADGTKCYIVSVIGGINSSFSTNSYALGAWSENNGYPEDIGIFQERLFYAGNKQKPTTIWLSRTNHWNDFELGTEDTSAMSFTLQTEKYDKFAWCMTTKSYIQIGSESGEWMFGEANGGVASPTNGRFVNTSNIGGKNIPACKIGSVTLMVKTGGEEIHRTDYNTLSEESAGTQVSMLSRHLFEGDPVEDMFAVRSPTNTVYCLCHSGKLVSFTYEPEYDVAGWARHEILDGVLGAAVLRRSGRDVLTMIVKKGERILLGEIDMDSGVYEDDGESYESLIVPTPFSIGGTSGSAYGGKGVFAGVDVYVVDGVRFEVKLSGGEPVVVDEGFSLDGRTLNAFEENRVSIPAASGWKNEALIEIKTDYAGPLSISAVGAALRSGA